MRLSVGDFDLERGLKKNGTARSGYLPGVLHVVLLARPSAHATAGGGAGLLRAAQHDGVLVEVAGSLHRHPHRAGLLAHVVAAERIKTEQNVSEMLVKGRRGRAEREAPTSCARS